MALQGTLFLVLQDLYCLDALELARQATKCACQFHQSLSADSRQPTPSGPDWVHELKHDGYRLQIHVRDGRVRLYTMNGADWSKRYP